MENVFYAKKNVSLEGLPRPLGVIFGLIRQFLVVSLFAQESTRFRCNYAALFENPPARQLFVSVFSRALHSSDARDGEGGVDCVFLFFSVFFCFFLFFFVFFCFFLFFFVFFRIKNVFFCFFSYKKRYRRLAFFFFRETRYTV